MTRPARQQEPDCSCSWEDQTGIRDDFIDFGDILFAPGKAFAWDGLDPTAPNSPAQITFLNPVLDPSAVPVAKRWTAIDATTSILMESVKWTDVQPALSQLPEMAKVSSPGSSGGHDELQNSPSPQGTDFKRRRIELASATQKNPGVVLDYLMVSGNGDYEFSTFNGVSNAYYLTGNNVFNGKVTFDASCVIKRARGGASLILAGTVACNGNATQPSILTMEDDDVFGQGDLIPPNNVNCPQITSGPAVWVWYSMPGTVGLSGLRVRFAQTAVQFDGSACATDRIVANSLFDNCTTGIYATNCKLTISTLTVCDVATPIASTGCAVSGGYSPPATLADQIISATQAATGPTKNGQIWNYSTNGYPISWNTSSAVYGLQGYTSMSPSNSASGDGVEWYQGPCTLITPLHAIGVSPFHSQGSFVNHVYRFIGSDNTHQVVTCVGHIAVTNNGTYVDLGILRFDQPIMATVDRAKFLADPSQKLPLARLSNWLSGQAITDCKLLGVPCIRVNQHKNAWIEDWCTVSASGTWLCGFRQPSLWITDPTARWTYPGGVQPGDSGHPAFAIVGSQLALGGPLYSGDDICIFGDVILSNINSGIYTVDMQTSGTNSGYTASTVDLTGFPNL